MSACEFSAFEKFDLGACAGSLVTGWIPDWLWPWLPYWPWAAVLIGAGVAWRFAGTPGLVGFSALVGFILGRRSVETHEHVDGKDAIPAPPPPKKAQANIRQISYTFQASRAAEASASNTRPGLAQPLP